MTYGLRKSVRLAALAAVGAGCLMVAACGSGSAAAASRAAGASAGASSTPDPLAGLSANKIAAKAIVNLEAAPSVTMAGSLVVSGQPFTVTVGIKPGAGCAGSIGTSSKVSIQLIMIGKTVYIRPNDAYWKAHAGSNANAAIKWENGRYIKTTASGFVGSANEVCDLSQTLGPLKLGETMTKGKLTTLDGIKVLPLTNGPDGTLWVTDTAKPELVKMELPAGSNNSTTGVLTFSPGVPIPLTAPPASDVVEGSAAGSS